MMLESNIFVKELMQRLVQSSFSQAADWSVAVGGFVIYGITLRFAIEQLRRNSLRQTFAIVTKRLVF
jgi:hypothetical protein